MAYVLTGEKSGTVLLDAEKTGVITSEAATGSSKVTSNPVEKGADINDHVIPNPMVLSLTGVLIGGMDAYKKLVEMQKNGELCEYTGRIHADHLVITNLKSDIKADNRDGCSITMTLQQVNMVGSEYVPIGEAETINQQDGNKTQTNEGLKTPAQDYVSDDAYVDYVNSYNNKPASSAGPLERTNPSYNGINKGA